MYEEFTRVFSPWHSVSKNYIKSVIFTLKYIFNNCQSIWTDTFCLLSALYEMKFPFHVMAVLKHVELYLTFLMHLLGQLWTECETVVIASHFYITYNNFTLWPISLMFEYTELSNNDIFCTINMTVVWFSGYNNNC